MKIMGVAAKPSTSMPHSPLIVGEKGPSMRVAPFAFSQSSAACVSPRTTSRSSMASSAPNCAGLAPTGVIPSL